MFRKLSLIAIGTILVSHFGFAADPAKSSDADKLVIRYHDGKPDGKKSIAGTGEMIQFSLAEDSQKFKGLRLHCARYGQVQPPKEDVEITLVSEDETKVIHTEEVPYAKFKRGESQWTTLVFKEPIAVEKNFWVIINFNAEATKGVYLSFDTSTGGKHSKTGVPGGESKAVTIGGDWMIEALLTKPQ